MQQNPDIELTTCDGVKFSVKPENRLYNAGIMKLLKSGTIPIHSDLFQYFVTPENIPSGKLVKLIRTVLPLCIPYLQDKFVADFITFTYNSFGYAYQHFKGHMTFNIVTFFEESEEEDDEIFLKNLREHINCNLKFHLKEDPIIVHRANARHPFFSSLYKEHYLSSISEMNV